MSLAAKIHGGLKTAINKKVKMSHFSKVTQMDDGSFHIEHHSHEKDRYGDGYCGDGCTTETASSVNGMHASMRRHYGKGGGLKDTAKNQMGGGKGSTQQYQREAARAGEID